jgi:predicted phage terminase large subunit-like protein
MHKLRDGRHLVSDVVKGQWAAGEREKIIRNTAELDGTGVHVWVEQEPGSGGKESAENTIRNLAGYHVKADKVTGNKEVRAEPYADQVEAGNVQVLRADWTKEFIAEHEIAPRGKFMDQWDAAAGAFNKLNVKVKVAGVWGRRHG